MFVEKSLSDKEGIRPFAKTSTPALVSALKEVLSDEVKLYFKSLGYHWNVKGADFAQYHELFQDIYEDVYSSIDPTAENILKMGATAPFGLMEFQTMSSIRDTALPSDPRGMAADLLVAHEQILICLNKAFNVANSSMEQGVANFLAERIDMTQKWIWQLTSSVAINKAVAKTENGVAFPAEAFAYVPDPTMPSTWKLRLWDNLSDKETRQQIGAAIAALGVGFRGQKVELPTADRPAVVARVRAAWKKTHGADEEMPAVLK